MLFEISSAEINEVGDTCVLSLGTDETFFVNDARCIIDSKILPSLAPSTVWDKNIPRKRATFLYKNQKEEFRSTNTEKISGPITKDPEFVSPSVEEKCGLDADNKPVEEGAAEDTVMETTIEKDEPTIQKLDAVVEEHKGQSLIQVNKDMEERLEKHGARLYTLERLDIPQQVSKVVSEVVTNAVDWDMQTPLRNRFRDLPEADMKEILHQRMNSRKTWLKHARKRKRVASHLKRHLGLHLISHLLIHQRDHPELQKLLELLDHPTSSISLTLADLEIDEDMAPDEQAQSSDDEDIKSVYILKVNLRQDWWKPFEEERPATLEPAWSIRSSDVPVLTNNWASALASNYSSPPEDSLLAQTDDITIFMDWLCKRHEITKLKPQDLEVPIFEIVKVFHPDVIHLQYQMEECHKLLTDSVDDPILRHNVSKPLPLGGPPGQVAYYPDVGLEQMVPDQFWIEKECKYDIAAMYGISHWWFQRQRFYIDRHTSKGDRHAVMTHMRIPSVVRIEVFSMYGYDYMKKIVLRRADLNEHVIAERDFKYLYPSDFEDMYLLNHQGHLNHLPSKDKKILTTTDKYEVHMMIRFNEIHKFSDGALQQIDEALDYRVKKFRINRMNPGLNTRFWNRKDVDRSKAFVFAIQKQLKTRRIFRNLESFIGRRVREGDYRLLKRTDLSSHFGIPGLSLMICKYV
nr:hypothetical protein [Tanacetum cinerariifolium]